MKNSINTLTEALAYHLEAMHAVEKLVEEKLSRKATKSAGPLALEIARYGRSSKYKRMKLKRVFGYLMVSPYGRDTAIAENFVRCVQRAANQCDGTEAANVITALQMIALISYKASSYEQAVLIAERLDLETAASLLEEIREMETVSMMLFRRMTATAVAELEKNSQLVA